MSNKIIRLRQYFRYSFKNSNNMDDTLLELISKFPSYYDDIVDIYIVQKEKDNNIYKKQKKLVYDSQLKNRKSQTQIIKKLIDNINL